MTALEVRIWVREQEKGSLLSHRFNGPSLLSYFLYARGWQGGADTVWNIFDNSCEDDVPHHGVANPCSSGNGSNRGVGVGAAAGDFLLLSEAHIKNYISHVLH